MRVTKALLGEISHRGVPRAERREECVHVGRLEEPLRDVVLAAERDLRRAREDARVHRQPEHAAQARGLPVRRRDGAPAAIPGVEDTARPPRS